MNRSGLLCLLLLPLQQAVAGEWDKEGQALKTNCGEFTGFGSIASCGAFLFNSGKPLRLMIPTSVVPGGGTALGPLFIQPLDIHNWPESNLTMNGGSSLRGFWFGNATVTLNHRKFGGDWNTARDEFQIKIYSRARGLPRMPYYGIGPHTSTASLADYNQRDISLGTSIFIPLQSWFAAGGSTEFLSTRIQGETTAGVRSIDTYYSQATAPGLDQTASYAHFQVFARPKKDWKYTNISTNISYDYYQNRGPGLFSSHKFRMDYLQKIYPERHNREPKFDSVFYIAGRFTSSGAAAGHVVPFYLLETIGGTDIDNQPTLRGFADYRFRAPALFEIQTQYERRLLPSSPPGTKVSTMRSIAGAIGILAFYDAGEVATQASSLDFSHMRQSYGFGLSLWAGNKVWFRTYIGLGSGEGHHLFNGVSDPSSQSPHL